MNCQQVNKLIERYDEGELPQEVATQVESHLHTCAECQAILRLAEKERLGLQSTEDIPELTPDFAGTVMARISVVPRSNLTPLVPIWVEWTRRYSTLLGTAAVMLLFLFPLLGQPAINNEIVPMQSKTAQKMAAIDQAQNVLPVTTAVIPQSATLNEPQYRSQEPNYRSQESAENPSRSTPTKGLTGNSETLSSPQLPLSLDGAAVTDPVAGAGAIAPSVAPSYIPSGYILDKIEVTEDNRVLASYLAIGDETATPLVITIAPDTPSEKPNDEKMMIMKDKATPDDKGGDVLQAPAALAPQQAATLNAAGQETALTVQAVYNGHTYRMTSNLPLASEEMDNLSRSLQPR